MSWRKADKLLGELNTCLKLLKRKQVLDDAKVPVEAFESEFSEEYAKLLARLKRDLAEAETEEEIDEIRARFMTAAGKMMTDRLRKRMEQAIANAWRSEDESALAKLLAEKDALAKEAIIASFIPRLDKASKVEKESLLQKLSAVGSYGMTYAGMVWAGFWASHVLSGPPEARYLWDGTLDDATCDTCEDRIGNEYKASELPGMPGDQSTTCDGKCRCRLAEV